MYRALKQTLLTLASNFAGNVWTPNDSQVRRIHIRSRLSALVHFVGTAECRHNDAGTLGPWDPGTLGRLAAGATQRKFIAISAALVGKRNPLSGLAHERY